MNLKIPFEMFFWDFHVVESLVGLILNIFGNSRDSCLSALTQDYGFIKNRAFVLKEEEKKTSLPDTFDR